MAVEISIIEEKGVYLAHDSIVQSGEAVIIKTDILGVDFKVVVPNEDLFFDKTESGSAVTIIHGTVDSSNPLELGNVTGNGKPTKYYTIDPSIDAPPRIIRVAS
jgi:hypothetical protein